ncbi:TPA: hypothetical protein DEB00_00745 [Candidatus Uhrbacteria bacterium]|nr:hypothetical protein [Candidatus Uhrbacteria bacterium]
MMPKIAIQYVTYWSEEARADIDACMQSLQDLNYDRDRVCLIVVDNPSPSGTARAYLEKPWLHDAHIPKMHLIDSPVNDGFSGGHNRAYEHARTWGAEYLYLLNQDARVDPHVLNAAIAYATQHPQEAIVQSLIVSEQDHTHVDSYGNVLHYLGFGYQDPDLVSGRPHFYGSGAGLLVRVDALDHIGGLFETSYFMYHEDVDLAWRARLGGYGVGVAHDSIVYHRYEFSRSITKFYWMERNRWVTQLTHLAWPTFWLILPMALFMELGTLLFALKGGWLKTKGQVYTYFLQPASWRWIMARRKHVQAVRVVTDAELLRCMAPTIEAQQTASWLLDVIVNSVLAAYYQFLLFVIRR